MQPQERATQSRRPQGGCWPLRKVVGTPASHGLRQLLDHGSQGPLPPPSVGQGGPRPDVGLRRQATSRRARQWQSRWSRCGSQKAVARLRTRPVAPGLARHLAEHFEAAGRRSCSQYSNKRIRTTGDLIRDVSDPTMKGRTASVSKHSRTPAAPPLRARGQPAPVVPNYAVTPSAMASTAPMTRRYSPSEIRSSGLHQSKDGLGLRNQSRAGSSPSTARSWPTTAFSASRRSSLSRRGATLELAHLLTLRGVEPVTCAMSPASTTLVPINSSKTPLKVGNLGSLQSCHSTYLCPSTMGLDERNEYMYT